MDWHSSGITTSMIGALKRGLGPLEKELGIHVCGGRGKYSRQTPHELVALVSAAIRSCYSATARAKRRRLATAAATVPRRCTSAASSTPASSAAITASCSMPPDDA
jgi:hypothetical protein